MALETLPWGNPIGDNYHTSPFYLNERGARRYAELVGFQRALTLHDEEAAAHLGAEFCNVVKYVSTRVDVELECAPGVKIRVPSSTVVAGDDGAFGCFTFARYAPSPISALKSGGNFRMGFDDRDVFRDWRPGATASPPQGDGQSFVWAFAYNGAIIYRGPRSADDWRAWRTFSGRWWSSHT